MQTKIQKQLRAGKRRIERRLDKSKLGDCSRPAFAAANVHYEFAQRARGISYGGLGASRTSCATRASSLVMARRRSRVRRIGNHCQSTRWRWRNAKST